MKNLKNICKQRIKHFIKNFQSNGRFFSEQVKVDRNEYKDNLKFDEEKNKFDENDNNNNTKNSNDNDKIKKKTKVQESIFSKSFTKFKDLWKHTFNYSETIEEKMEKRKQEAILNKTLYKELSQEEIENVK
jgi:hypothetical protein